MDPSAEQDKIVESVLASPLAMVLSNPRRPDNPLEVANAEFCELTGYSEAEIIGRNCRFLAGHGSDASVTEMFRAGIRMRRPVLAEIVNYRRDGTSFRNGVMITPLYDDDAQLVWFLGSQVDLGQAPTPALADRRSSAEARVADLPRRQRQVLAAMARGLLNKQIAWELKISEKTVKMHRALLIERLGVRTTAEAIRIGIEAGL